MKFRSALLDQASGSLAGMTAARNRGGGYLRSRTIPTNPSSAAQVNVRGSFSAASAAWSLALTEAQRQAWIDYASATPWVDVLGEARRLSGQQMFVRTQSFFNMLSSYGFLGGPLTMEAPITPGLGPSVGFESVTIALGAGPPLSATLAITLAEAVNATTTAVFLSPVAQSAGRYYFKGPYRLCIVEENASAALVSENMMAAAQPWAQQGLSAPLEEGLYFGYYRQLASVDGPKLGTPVRFGPIEVPALP